MLVMEYAPLLLICTAGRAGLESATPAAAGPLCPCPWAMSWVLPVMPLASSRPVSCYDEVLCTSWHAWSIDSLLRSFLLLQLLSFLKLLMRAVPQRKGCVTANARIRGVRSCLFGAPLLLCLAICVTTAQAAPETHGPDLGCGRARALGTADVPPRERTPPRVPPAARGCTPMPSPGWDATFAPSTSPLLQPFDKQIAIQVLRFQMPDRFCALRLSQLHGEADLLDTTEEVLEAYGDGLQFFAVRPQPAADLVVRVAIHTQSLLQGRNPVCFQLHRPDLPTRYWSDVFDSDVGIDDVQEALGSDWIPGALVFVEGSSCRLSAGERRAIAPGSLIRVLHPRLRNIGPTLLADKLLHHERHLRDVAVTGLPEEGRVGLVYGLLQLLEPPTKVHYSPGLGPRRRDEVLLSHASRDWGPYMPVWPQQPIRNFLLRGERVFQVAGAFPATLCGRVPIIVDGRLVDLPLRLYASKTGTMPFSAFLDHIGLFHPPCHRLAIESPTDYSLTWESIHVRPGDTVRLCYRPLARARALGTVGADRLDDVPDGASPDEHAEALLALVRAVYATRQSARVALLLDMALARRLLNFPRPLYQLFSASR